MNMFQPPSRADLLVLAALHSAEPMTMEHIAERIPELSWNELFHAVDAMSRRGDVMLRRKGFAYYVSLPCMSRISA
jgi:hypothetical protein